MSRHVTKLWQVTKQLAKVACHPKGLGHNMNSYYGQIYGCMHKWPNMCQTRLYLKRIFCITYARTPSILSNTGNSSKGGAFWVVMVTIWLPAAMFISFNSVIVGTVMELQHWCFLWKFLSLLQDINGKFKPLLTGTEWGMQTKCVVAKW